MSTGNWSKVDGPKTFMVLCATLNDNPRPMPSGVSKWNLIIYFERESPNIQARFEIHTQALFEKQGL